MMQKIIILMIMGLSLMSNLVFSQSDVPCGAPALTIGSSCSYTTGDGAGYTLADPSENVANPASGASACGFYGFAGFSHEDNWYSFVAPASGTCLLYTSPSPRDRG